MNGARARAWAAWGALVGVCAGWIAVIWAWDVAYLTLTVDDAFYYQVIARRIAAGEGVTFDGIERTNGFHPLWMAALAAVASLARGADAATLMRVTLTLQVGIVATGVAALARGMSALRVPPVIVVSVATLALAQFYAAKIVVNGQESAIALALAAATMGAWWRGARPWVIGALAGMTALARLDAIVLGVAIAAMAAAGADRRRRWRDAAAMLAAMGVPIAAYVGWNAVSFGHVVPVSVVVKSGWIAGASAGRVLVAAVPVALLAVLVGRALRGGGARALLPLAAWGAAVLSFAWLRGLPVPEIWYLVPLFAGALAAVAILVARGPRALAGAIAVMHLGGLALGWAHRLDPASYAPYVAARDAGVWIARTTPRDAVAAGWDAGIVAAHAERRFAQLEGLVGSFRFAREHVRRGDVAGHVDAIDARYLAQPLPREWLGSREPLVYDGLAIGEWHVVRAICAPFVPALPPRRRREVAQVVLMRDGGGPTLESVRATICESGARQW